jgi:hypothetical protein
MVYIHTYTLVVYKRDGDELIYDHRNKNIQHESCVKRCDEATRQRKFKTADRVRQNLTKFSQNSFKHEHKFKGSQQTKLENR